jgi:hypothetical protein
MHLSFEGDLFTREQILGDIRHDSPPKETRFDACSEAVLAFEENTPARRRRLSGILDAQQAA